MRLKQERADPRRATNRRVPRGSRIVNLFYPGRINMPEHTGYLVRVQGGSGSVLLYRHLQPVEALDFQNQLRQEILYVFEGAAPLPAF
jgi:hypothetical protein